ncbi:HAD-IIA family hydrolase [Mycolicibacterium thermoresistibile]
MILAENHDCLLLDLDGTVFRGHEPTAGAVDTLRTVRARTLYVTNNASRAPADVATHLQAMGFSATAEDVVTSAQSGARLLAAELPPGAPVLILGTESLADEVSTVGLKPVRRYADHPVAVVQGHSPDTGWAQLAEAALAIRAGAWWVATNVDRTLPSDRGLLPGNGSMVAALRAATDREPQVAGKPQPTLMTDALSRGDFERPLVVGDRLDTDIAGANNAGLPSLLVLTGVNSAADAVRAIPVERPDMIAPDLRSLHTPAAALRVAPQPAWRVRIDAATVQVGSTGADPGDPLSVVRATAHAVWSADLGVEPLVITAVDDTARAALHHWALLSDPID